VGIQQQRRRQYRRSLPDLRTLIVGGAGSDGNRDVGFAQYWDPRDGSLTRSGEAIPEICGYHTTATLLADGSVFMTCGQPTRVPQFGGERGTPTYLLSRLHDQTAPVDCAGAN
jgi:hypothetical protein